MKPREAAFRPASFRRAGPTGNVRVAVAVVCAALISGGCATTGEDHESDLPWNVRQPWEGAPSLPGMSY